MLTYLSKLPERAKNNWRKSLRFRLQAMLLSVTTLLMIPIIFHGYKASEHEMREVLDNLQYTVARAVFPVLETAVESGDKNVLAKYHQSLPNPDRLADYKLILLGSDGVVHHSTLDEPFKVDPAQADGFFSAESAGHHWRVYQMTGQLSGNRLYFAQSQRRRSYLTGEATEPMLTPWILGSILVMLAVWFTVRRGLQPLERIHMTLEQRKPADLSPIEITDDYVEIKPVLSKLNELLQQVSGLLEKERQFSADASHELRTPLAGIQANLDALKGLHSQSDRAKHLKNVEIGVDKAAEIIEGLLLFSRLDSDFYSRHLASEHFTVQDALLDEMAAFHDAHGSQDVRLEFIQQQEDATDLVSGSRLLFGICINNLLKNAYTHSEKPVHIQVKLESAKQVTVYVEDDGPGIPEAELQTVFDRFHQVDVTQGHGSGLGLAIVRRIVELFNGSVNLVNVKPQGLQVAVQLKRWEKVEG